MNALKQRFGLNPKFQSENEGLYMRHKGVACRNLSVGLALAGTALALVGATAQTPAKHPFAAKDWATLHSAGAAAVSPDGAILYRVAFGGNRGFTHNEWWTMLADGTHSVKLNLPENFWPLGFSRNGHSLYGSWKVNKLQQLAIFPLDGESSAAPSTVALLPRGIVSATPSPDGKRFAIVADPRSPDPLDEVRHVQGAQESSLYVVNADGTGGAWWCSNLKNVSAAVWSADNESLAMLSPLPKLGHHNVSVAIDVCGATGAHHVTDIPNDVNGIAWAEHGRELAFLSTTSATLTPEHVWTVSPAGGAAEDQTPMLDGTAMELAGDAQGNVWVLVDHGVRREADEFRAGTLKPVYRWPDGIVAGLPVSSPYHATSEQVALTVGDPTHTGNVATPEGDHLRKITHEGDEQLAEVELGKVRVVQWKSKEGIVLEGIATFPAGYVEGRKYPFLVLPHGGPEENDALCLNSYDSFARMIAGLGYVVLQPEYRGSTGYGSTFLAAIYQHAGDRAYRDVDSATDYAIAQGWADPHRLAIFGWSAGGFMAAWTVTQTNRYRAAIEGAGITDWASFMWTDDEQALDYDARWTDKFPEAFSKFSAMSFAYRVTTPLLILHGEADTRVPTYQGTEFFQILAARGKTVRMVTYPGSHHVPALWEQRLNVMQEITDWLAEYNK
jgi:dipeptidyl aminopeptidase/acylaminoacyl peptidase